MSLQSSEVIGSVVYLCSFVPHASVATVSGFCLSRIRAAPLPDEWTAADVASFGLIPVYVKALCNWGR